MGRKRKDESQAMGNNIGNSEEIKDNVPSADGPTDIGNNVATSNFETAEIKITEDKQSLNQEVAPGRQGTDTLLAEMETQAQLQEPTKPPNDLPITDMEIGTPKKRGRRPQAEIDAENTIARMEASAPLIDTALAIMAGGFQIMANRLDPMLKVIDPLSQESFALNDMDKAVLKTAMQEGTKYIDPETLKKWQGYLIIGSVVVVVVLPRYQMYSKIKTYAKEMQKEKV